MVCRDRHGKEQRTKVFSLVGNIPTDLLDMPVDFEKLTEAGSMMGSEALLVILERICKGEGKEDDINLLEELSYAISEASLCGLGKSLPNPIISTLRYFKDEYMAHIKDKKCPGKICKALFEYRVKDNCILCGLCARACSEISQRHAISFSHRGSTGQIQTHFNQLSKECIGCGVCAHLCPTQVIKIEEAE